MISFIQLMIISALTAIIAAQTGTIVHLLVFDAVIIVGIITVRQNFPTLWNTHICATQPIDGDYPQP